MYCVPTHDCCQYAVKKSPPSLGKAFAKAPNAAAPVEMAPANERLYKMRKNQRDKTEKTKE